MNIGRRSVIFGVHQFLIHPFFVFLAWWELYGFPRDPRLWIAFFVHDLGHFAYNSKMMDDEEGERHVEWGANLMRRWFGDEWGDLCLYHSRFYARKNDHPISRLCVADKLAMSLEPFWLYLPRVLLSGEIHEYRKGSATPQQNKGSKYIGEPNPPHIQRHLSDGTLRGWHKGVQRYCRDFAYHHEDLRDDTWTPKNKGR